MATGKYRECDNCGQVEQVGIERSSTLCWYRVVGATFDGRLATPSQRVGIESDLCSLSCLKAWATAREQHDAARRG